MSTQPNPNRFSELFPDIIRYVSEQRAARMWEVASARQRGVTVLLEDVQNPYNLAAIARTCDAFGVQQLDYMCQTQAAFDPQEVGARASRSAARWVDYTYHEGDTAQTLQAFRQAGYHLVATSVGKDTIPLAEADLRHEQLLLLVGSERRGLSPTALALADTRVVVPMAGMVRSLNVSVATSLVLYEVARQRQSSDYFYDEQAVMALVARWLTREQRTRHTRDRA